SHRQDWHYQEQFARFLEVFGKREQAITTWHEVLKIVPQYLAGRFQLAQLLGQSADSAVEAESLAQGLVDERPEIAVFHLALGRALYAQSRDVEAIEVFKKTVSMNPDELAAWIMMGASYRQIQKPEEAIACFERVLQK
ncbi:MAG: tetratricopeptide repeat protein, partial [Verrucomicrobiota bacterium]